jgi:gas vesicle protein
MINRIKSSFNTGLMRMRWIAVFLAERTKAETSIVKLMYESSKLDDRIDNLHKDIGKRVMELKEKGDESVFQDFQVQQALAEVKNLQEEVEEYKKEARSHSKLPE